MGDIMRAIILCPSTHHAMVYVQWSPTYEATLGE